MKLTETNHHIAIAQQQANISLVKHQYWQRLGHPYKTQMYWVRYKALCTYVEHLKHEIKKYERKAFRRINQE